MGRLNRATRQFLPMLAAVLVVACSPGSAGYDTDLPPPSGRETFVQVLPAAVSGYLREVEAVDLDGGRYRGARARYGAVATVEIVLSRQPADIDPYVQQHLRPRLQRYLWRFAGKVDGRWGLRGDGPSGRFHGWQNQNWLFVIQAENVAAFNEVVDQFAFIERR